MKTLGIIGGIAPESTIAYYRAIMAAYKRRITDGSQPPLIINSIDMMKMLGMIGEGKFVEVTDYLVGELNKVVNAGAQVAFFASNTPHIVFDDLRKQSQVPLISIVECAAAHAKSLRLKRIALLGTRFTMKAGFYAKVFEKEDMVVILPAPAEQDLIHEKYMGELVEGNFKPDTRTAVLKIIDQIISDEKIDGVILGGTELPLLIQANEHRGIPLIDTCLIHAEAAVEQMLR
jgi:aspartate racemase